MKKKINVGFRFLGKIGFLLVVAGFFFPISSIGVGRLQFNGGNGFELAKAMMDRQTVSAILVYVVFAAAVAGVLVGVLLLLKNKVKVYVDWVCLLACIGSGLVVYLPRLDDAIKPNLQTGGYLILAGWIIALAAQVIAQVNKEA